jgi:hypothetical protein
MKGWVYIITTKSMPDLVKIGFSTKDPALRAAEFNNTGNPYPYTVRYEALVNEPRNVEQSVHRLLKNRGFHENKEWFKCSIEIAVAAIRETASNDIIHESVKFSFDADKRLGLAQCSTKDFERDQSQKIGKFIVQAGIATDTETGLMWLRFAYGQQWERNDVIGDAKNINWQDAMAIPETFNQIGYAGYTDWCVPSISELKTLIYRNKDVEGCYTNSGVFPKNPTCFWSSSTSSGNNRFAWYINFHSGGSTDYSKSIGNYIRLVRGKRKGELKW